MSLRAVGRRPWSVWGGCGLAAWSNPGACLSLDTPQLKTQVWQLLKGHDHLQDEFSVFFDHLRPAASRLGDFEEIHWTEEKEYEVRVPGRGASGSGPAV